MLFFSQKGKAGLQKNPTDEERLQMLNQIYDEFSNRVRELEATRDKKIGEILHRLENRKMQDILKKAIS